MNFDFEVFEGKASSLPFKGTAILEQSFIKI
jgi:hypothetical protein